MRGREIPVAGGEKDILNKDDGAVEYVPQGIRGWAPEDDDTLDAIATEDGNGRRRMCRLKVLTMDIENG